MKLLQKPRATVGQIVKDLEQIVAINPNIFLEYSNEDSESMFVKEIKLQDDIVILETTGYENRAATIKDLLAKFRMLDASLGVVLHDFWEMLDFNPHEDGSIFQYDEEDECCFFEMERNVRLVTTQQMEAELEEKRDDAWDYSSKIAPVWPKPRKAIYMNSLQWRHGKLCLCYDKDEDNDGITVTSFMKEFPVCAEFMVFFKGKYYTVEMGENGMFFGFMMGADQYLGFKLGEVVYDPNDQYEL